jgi:hypothetical protein
MTRVSIVFFIVLALITLTAYGSPEPMPQTGQAPDSLRETALGETSPISLAPVEESTGSVGIVQLQDAFTPAHQNPFTWTFSLRFQNISHHGSAAVGDSTTYQFDQFGSTIKPIFLLGFLGEEKVFGNFSAQFGLSGALGFTNQDASVPTTGGSTVEGRLQTFDFSLQPSIVFPWELWRRISTRVYIESGVGQIAMASRDSTARFNKNSSFFGYGLELDLALTESWSFDFNYSEKRALSEDKNWTLDPANTQIGVGYKW